MQYVINNDKCLVIYKDNVNVDSFYNSHEIISGDYKREGGNYIGAGLSRSDILAQVNLSEEEVREQQRKRLEVAVRKYQEDAGIDAFFLMICYQFKDISDKANGIVQWSDDLWLNQYHNKKADILSGLAEVNYDFTSEDPVPSTFSEVRSEIGI